MVIIVQKVVCSAIVNFNFNMIIIFILTSIYLIRNYIHIYCF